MQHNIINYNIINKLKKKLSKGFKSSGGRNFLGRVCIKGRGFCKSSTKIVFRYLDFYRRINQKGILLNILYDPNRTSKIGIILYENGLSSFIIIQKGLKILDKIYAGHLYKTNINKGDSILINSIPLFSLISNIEKKPYSGGSVCRAAGTSALLINKDKNNNKGIIKLNSGWQMIISLDCISSYGIVSNKWNNKIIKKAGKNRGIGWKPKVRGVAKNPVDHCHGGGNGKKSKPVQPSNAWKTVFKGTPTKTKKFERLKKRLYKNLL
jgi:large subunit ribosomal protein L2